jgi:hypothetical protein
MSRDLEPDAMPTPSLPSSPLLVADTGVDGRGLPHGAVVVRVVAHPRARPADHGTPRATPRLLDRNIPAQNDADHDLGLPGPGDPR